jgi:hypothetical protein
MNVRADHRVASRAAEYVRRSVESGRAGRPGGACSACWAGRAGRARGTGGPLRPRGADRTLVSRRTSRACVTSRACATGRAGVARRTLWPCRAGRALQAGRAGWACLALLARRSRRARRALRSCRPGRAGLPVSARRACGAGWAGWPLGTGGTGRTLRTGRAGCPLRPGGPGRSCDPDTCWGRLAQRWVVLGTRGRGNHVAVRLMCRQGAVRDLDDYPGNETDPRLVTDLGLRAAAPTTRHGNREWNGQRRQDEPGEDQASERRSHRSPRNRVVTSAAVKVLPRASPDVLPASPQAIAVKRNLLTLTRSREKFNLSRQFLSNDAAVYVAAMASTQSRLRPQRVLAFRGDM